MPLGFFIPIFFKVHVGYGMIKSVWQLQERRTSLGRKKFIILSGPRAGDIACYTGSRGNSQECSGVRKQQ